MEMTEMTRRGHDCWLYRVKRIEKLLKFPEKEHFRLNKPGTKISIILRSKFDAFWLKQINEIKTNNPANLDHINLKITNNSYQDSLQNLTCSLYVTGTKGCH